MRDEIIVGLDVGSTKVCAVVAELGSDGRLTFQGLGVAPSVGMRKGMVVDIDETIRSIASAVEAAEHDADVDIDSVFLGVAGPHIDSTNVRGALSLAEKNHEVTEEDRAAVLDAALAAARLPENREVIHLLPRRFTVDDLQGVVDPVGIFASRLELEAHLVSGLATPLRNLSKAVQDVGLRVRGQILAPLGAAEAVLTADERELGAVLVDIGGGTTDIALYIEGKVFRTGIVPFGSSHITADIAHGLRTSLAEAERLKHAHCAVGDTGADPDLRFDVTLAGSNEVKSFTRRELVEIAAPRMEEILTLGAAEALRSEKRPKLSAGVILTGGGALIPGAVSLAERIFELPVRIGTPGAPGRVAERLAHPAFAVAVGLCHFGRSERLRASVRRVETRPLRGAIALIRSWFQDVF